MGIFGNGGYDGRVERVRRLNQEFDKANNPRPCPEGVDGDAWQMAEEARLHSDDAISYAGALGATLLERVSGDDVLGQSAFRLAAVVIDRTTSMVEKAANGVQDTGSRLDQ